MRACARGHFIGEIGFDATHRARKHVRPSICHQLFLWHWYIFIWLVVVIFWWWCYRRWPIILWIYLRRTKIESITCVRTWVFSKFCCCVTIPRKMPQFLFLLHINIILCQCAHVNWLTDELFHSGQSINTTFNFSIILECSHTVQSHAISIYANEQKIFDKKKSTYPRRISTATHAFTAIDFYFLSKKIEFSVWMFSNHIGNIPIGSRRFRLNHLAERKTSSAQKVNACTEFSRCPVGYNKSDWKNGHGVDDVILI